MKEINDIEELKDIIRSNTLSVIVFTMPSCSVCKPLKEKIEHILTNFPEVVSRSVDLETVKEAKGEYQIYTAPIIGLFAEGKESMRYSAAMNLTEFKQVLQRYQGLL